MATKILLTKNNTKLNIDNSNVYSFDSKTIKEQFIKEKYFNGENYKTLLNNSKEHANVWIDSTSISFSMSIDESGYSILELLNKNYCVVLEKGKEYFFFITEASKDNENLVSFIGELDIFMTYEVKTMFQGDIEINSGQVNRDVNINVVGDIENNFSFSENEEINDTWEDYNSLLQLKPISTDKLTELYGKNLDYYGKKFYNDVVSKTLWVYLKIKQTESGGETFKVFNSPTFTWDEDENDYIEIPGTLYVAPLNQESKVKLKYTCPKNKDKEAQYNTKEAQYNTKEEQCYSTFNVSNMIEAAGHANIESMYISNMVPFNIEDLLLLNPNDPAYIAELSTSGIGDVNIKNGALYITDINPYMNSVYNVKALDLRNEGYQINNISNKTRLINETGARHIKQYHISSIYSDTSYKIPPYLYGNIIYFRALSTNFDGSEETFLKIEHLENKDGKISPLTYGTGIGYKENINTMIPAANDVYEEMRINNKSSLALKSASSFLGLLAAPAVAYKKPMAGVGMAFGALSYGAKIADMKRAPSNITSFSADVIHKYANSINFKYFNCIIKQPTGNVLEMKQWDFILNGSKINVLSSNPFISERYYFNKIDYSNVYSNINLDISHKGKQIIADSCESGDMTVWHVRDLNTFKGVKNYEYENLEMEIYEKYKK